jgi:putative oxidoreductase
MTPPSASQETTQLLVAPGRLELARDRIDQLLRRFSLPLLRASLGLVFIWFGALKVADVTPARELVAGTIPWLDPDWLVPVLGWFEIAIGAVLMSGYLLGWVCAAMVAHLGGTFLTVVMQPEVMFQHSNPLMLTMEGEFVAKNLVLITAALVIAAWARRGRTGSEAAAG